MEQHPGASPQPRGIVSEVTGQCRHDRVGHVGGRHLELESDDTRPVAVELPSRHHLVQPTEPARLRHVTVVGRHRHATSGEPHGLLDAALGLRVRRPDRRRHDVGGIEGHPTGPVHGLAERAVLGPDALAPSGLGDGGVLHRGEGVDQRLAVADDREPLVAPSPCRFGECRYQPARTDRHGLIGPALHWAGRGGCGA